MRLLSSTTNPTGVSLRRLATIGVLVLITAASFGAASATASMAWLTPAHHRTPNPRAHGAATSGGCPDAATPVIAASRKAIRSAVVCVVNEQRTTRGLPALRSSAQLDRSAQAWTNDLVTTQTFTHGPDFSARITAAGFVWRSAGENIATGFPTPETVVTAWMASTDHCQNILNPTYSDVGTGVNRRPVKPYGLAPGTWTQDFGLPMGATAPSNNWASYRGCPYT